MVDPVVRLIQTLGDLIIQLAYGVSSPVKAGRSRELHIGPAEVVHVRKYVCRVLSAVLPGHTDQFLVVSCPSPLIYSPTFAYNIGPKETWWPQR